MDYKGWGKAGAGVAQSTLPIGTHALTSKDGEYWELTEKGWTSREQDGSVALVGYRTPPGKKKKK